MMRKQLALLLCLIAFTTLGAVETEHTLAIIKPDAVGNEKIGQIISRYENANLQITGLKMVSLSQKDAEAFYAIHRDRPFFDDLVAFMTSGPVVVLAVEGPDAVFRNRELIGNTDPKKAATGTLRNDYGSAINRNALHGSDSQENGRKEIAFFFKPHELKRDAA